MATCEITTSAFSAQNRADQLGMRKGWLAEAADQLINGKRYVGIDATAAATEGSLNTTKGKTSTIINDCRQLCAIYGQAYSSRDIGLLKSRAPVEAALECSQWGSILNSNNSLNLVWSLPNVNSAECTVETFDDNFNALLAVLRQIVSLPWSSSAGAFEHRENPPGPCGTDQPFPASGSPVDNIVRVTLSPALCEIQVYVELYRSSNNQTCNTKIKAEPEFNHPRVRSALPAILPVVIRGFIQAGNCPSVSGAVTIDVA